MDIHPYSATFTNDFDSRKSQADSPPPYSQSRGSPLLLAEMTTTRTEVVTTTTTETTTHLFSLPHWRKRNGPQSPGPQRNRMDDVASTNTPTSPSSTTLLDKALPPTPPDEMRDVNIAIGGILDPSSSVLFPPSMSRPDSFFSRTRKVSAGPQSTAALAHAALGIGLPHASTSLSRETSTISFISPPSPLSSPAVPSPSVRRVKSSQRVQQEHASENPENLVNRGQVVERRRRGLSFSTASFLNIGNSDIKGKGKEVEPASDSPKPTQKPLSRKSSFWSKKKGTQHDEPVSTSPQGDIILTLPPLPPVHHFSPLDISDFSIPSSPAAPIDLQYSQGISRRHCENALISHSPIPSPQEPIATTSFSMQNQSQMSLSDRVSEPQHTEDPSALPRPRTQANTPLLHRLSLAVFSSGELSSSAPSMRSSSHSQSSTISSPHPLTRKPETPIPKPLGEEESPEVYLTRLKSAVSKAEVAGILASSSDPFYSQALRAYINQFEFHDIPLDVALRKLLMEVGLPRETQQIDRVMEAFASRYMYCNANIFTSEDHPYILAFSLIMLHTDTFNPSNKRKMTKADYIKNTKLPGLPTEILDCFFDNIVFAPFIFIEDPVDFNGQPGLTADVARSLTINTPTSALSSSNGPATFKIGNKLDPYYLIINNLLEPLRVDVKSHVPLENPFTYEGTEGPWDEQELHGAFVNANIIDIDVPSVHRTGTVFSLNPSGIPLITDDTELPGMSRPKVATWSLKITKVGVLNRKDDILEGGKKSSNRKWRTWSVILTGSQLLLFRDPTWAAALSLSPDTPMVQQATSQPAAVFRPDESFSVKDAVAVYDRSYTKYKHTMRFVLPDGRQLLFQAADDMHLNEWISRINYASAFKSAGVRMRPPGLSGEDVHLTGVAAATSHLHDMQQRSQLRRHRSWDSNAAHDLMDMLSGQNRQPLKRRVTMSGRADFDLDVPTAPEIEGAEQFKATFDQVKADLATGSWSSLDNDPWLLQTEDRDNNIYESPPTSPGSSGSSASRFPSRSQIVQSKIRDLDSKILASQSQHDSDVRHIRNIAILTPFQKSTRSRLSAAIQNLAKRVALVRLDIEKLKCHRHVLRCDVASEGRSWNHSKQVALRAAKETLQSRCAHTIPTMTLSLHNDLATSSTADSSHLPNTPSSQRPESSASDSFHSAADFGIEWTSSEDLTFFTTYSELPKKSPSSPAPHAPPLDDCQDSRRSLSSSSNSNHRGSTQTEDIGGADSHEKGCDDEQAEEWNRTRCAQRVSLIHVPSHIRISTKMRGSADP